MPSNALRSQMSSEKKKKSRSLWWQGYRVGACGHVVGQKRIWVWSYKAWSHCCDFCFPVLKVMYVRCQNNCENQRKSKQLAIGVMFGGVNRSFWGKRWRGEDTSGLWPGPPGSRVPPMDGSNRGSKGRRAQGPGRRAISSSATCAVTGASPGPATRFLRSPPRRPSPGTFPVSVYRPKIGPGSGPGPPARPPL